MRNRARRAFSAANSRVGPLIQRILIGGEEVGHLTLTQLYFLHVGLLPLLVIGLLMFHIAQVIRHGLSMAELGGPQDDVSRWSAPNLTQLIAAHTSPVPPPRLKYFPYQTVRNMTVVTVVLGIIAILAWQRGAPLDAPADPVLTAAARTANGQRPPKLCKPRVPPCWPPPKRMTRRPRKPHSRN